MMRHRVVRVVGEQRSNRALSKPSTPKRTKTRHHDVAEGDCATGSLLATIALSQRSVHLTTGFFVPTPDLARALITAARRGVDVQLVVPRESDSSAAVAAGRAEYGELLEAGVHIHERQQKILHAKTAVVDGAWSAVGSSNLDWRSTVWNNEIDAIILGPEFGGQMEVMFQGDVRASHTIDLASWRHRGLGERFRELRSKLVETLL